MDLYATLIAALAALAAGPPDLTRDESPSSPSAALVRDGDRFIAVTRAPDDPRHVHLHYPDGRAARATIGRHLVVHVADPALLPAYDLAFVAPLMPRAGLYRATSTHPHEDALAAAHRLAHDPSIDALPDFAFPRTRHAISIPPDDPRHGGQWYLHTIDMHAAWRLETGDPSVVVGVVDDGCDLDHPDLAAHMLPGTDLVDDDDDPSYLPNVRGNEHGTACAGLVAAIGDNGVGIAGACPECHLRCVRLLPGGQGGEVPIGNDIAAYDRQLAWNVAVSSNSWGFEDHFPVPNLLRRAIATLIAEGRDGKGTIVVFAAGNDAREVLDDELYGIEGVLTVGAINQFDEAASFSNSGGPVDLVAPAGTLTTDIAGPDGADEGDYTSLFGGTSSACPVAAGVAALLVAAAPDKTALELVDALVRTTRPAPFALPDEHGHDPLYGYGVIDPAAALAAVMPAPTPDEVGPEPIAEADPEPTADAPLVEPAEASEPPRDEGCTTGAPPGWLIAALALAMRRRARA